MSFETKTTGKASFRTFDLECTECGWEEERTLDCRNYDSVEAAWDDSHIACPNCDDVMLQRVWRKAPGGKVRDDDGEIASMKQSFKERFVKKEMFEVQHKHGRLFGDSIRSAAATRIAKGEA